jgi:hypothetical protein
MGGGGGIFPMVSWRSLSLAENPTFSPGALELWDLSRRRRHPKLHVALELLVSSRRRRQHMLLVALEFLVSTRRRSRTLHVALELWALRLFRWRRQPSPRALLEL